jgi:hypothetical protein
MPRAGSIATRNVAGGIAYEFLPTAYEQIREMAIVGMPISSMAKFFGVSETWLANELKVDPFAAAAFAAETEGELELRKAMHQNALDGSDRMQAFLGERRLGMRKEVEVKHEHVHRVIGAQPTYKLTAEEWQEKYAPKELPAPKDAEFEEIGDKEEEHGP